ncbi:MAG TPA: glycerophosphodiester phosphodiesterase family protein, partial [Polyangiaceae bacterium]|nr:glycerophosphodiester phosphodiesterase family protein [Polyangiaceae bacterium]
MPAGSRLLVGLGLAAWAMMTLQGCESSPDAHIPGFSDGGLLREGRPLSREQLSVFEGGFDLTEGSDLLGDDLSIRTTIGTVSLLTDKNAGFAVLGAACLADDELVLEGYWQYPTRAESGLVRLFVAPEDVARQLCRGQTPETSAGLELRGYFGNDDEFPRVPIALHWARELKPWRGRFFTVAHHGACENTDHCGVSPNSLETIRLSDRVGSNAIEPDVRATRDGIPILFHDPGLSSSLVRGLFCNGKISELSLAELRGNCALRYGETIPTLAEALQTIVDETELEAVYVDVKVPQAMLPTARIVNQVLSELERRNSNDDPSDDRHVGIVVAIVSDENLQAWRSTKATLQAEGQSVPPCLVEYDPDLVLSEGCVAWGPTWTGGPQTSEVERLRQAGAMTIFWTINQTDFID